MSTPKKIIFYYQSNQLDLSQVIGSNVTHIYISSIHFGKNDDGTHYIYLNDDNPDSPIYDMMWTQMNSAAANGIKILLMIGGAGGAYTSLFAKFDTYYPLLYKLLKEHPVITGCDLDIEEPVDLANVKMLIRRLKNDFPDFIISMAPVQLSLQMDIMGLGDFVYKDLWNSPEGKMIDFFNVQFYGDYSFYAFEKCVKNGYPPNVIVMGMMSSTIYDLEGPLQEIKQIVREYPDMAGVFNWEYFDTNPCPREWSDKMYLAMHST
jgi:hypothetical protein